jgi:homospermidine synthase
MQVAISVVAASMWMMENPSEGVCVPDDLPHDYILKIAQPYLGKFISKSSDWTPLQGRVNAFQGYNKPDLDLRDPWQFQNFLIGDSD